MQDPRNETSGFKGILKSNRFAWFLAIILLPVPMLLAYYLFPIGCLCLYGAATRKVFGIGMRLIWIRLFIGLLLREKREKIVIYMIMPFIIGLVITVLGQIIWSHLPP